MSQGSIPELSAMARSVRVGGFYEHYKGLLYQVIAVARHSETLEELVVYQAQYGDKSVWVRPVGMFLEEVQKEGKSVSRFKFIES